MKRVDMELIRRTVVGGTVADSVFSPMVEAILHLVDREGNSLGTVTGRVQARRRTEVEERVEDERKEFGFDKIALNSNTLHSPEASYAAVADADPFQAFGRLGDEDDEGLATDLSLSKAFKSEQNINSPLFKTVVTHSLPTRRRTDGVGAGMNRNPKPTPFESYDFTQDFHAANDNSINVNSAYGNSITGNAVNGNSITENSVNGNSVNGIAANDNAAKRAASNGNSVAGYAGNSNPFNGNAVKRIAVNGNAINGNAVNGNSVNKNAITGNAINRIAANSNSAADNSGRAIPKVEPAFPEDDFFADDGLDDGMDCPKPDTFAGAGGARLSKAKTDGSKSNAFSQNGAPSVGSKSNGSGLNGSTSDCSKLNGSRLSDLKLNGSTSNCLELNGSGLASSPSSPSGRSESDTWEEDESDRSFHFRNHIELWQMGEEATLVLHRPGWARRMVRRRIRLMKEGMNRLKSNTFRRFPRIARRIAALDAVHVPFRPSFLRKPTGGKAGGESEELIPLKEFDRWDQFQRSQVEAGAIESPGRNAVRATLEDNPAGRHERERGAKRGQDLAASQGANRGPGQNRLVMARSIAWGMSATALGLSLAFLTLAMVGCEGTDAEGAAGAAALTLNPDMNPGLNPNLNPGLNPELNPDMELTAANSDREHGHEHGEEVSENGRKRRLVPMGGSGGSMGFGFGILPLSPVSKWTPGGLLKEAPMNGDGGEGRPEDSAGAGHGEEMAGECGNPGDAGEPMDSGDTGFPGASGFPESSVGGEFTGIPEHYGNPDDAGEPDDAGDSADAGVGDADSHEPGENETGGAGSGGGCPPAPSGNHSENHGGNNSNGHGSAALALGNGDLLPAVRWFVDRLEDGLAAVMDEEGETWIVSENELPEGAREGAYFLAGPLFPKDGFGGECPKWNTDTEAELLWLDGVPVPVPPDCQAQFCQMDEEYGEAIAQQIASTLANLMAGDDGGDIVL